MGSLPTDDAGEYWKAFSEAGDEIAENMRSIIATLCAENEALRAQIASIRDETLEEAAKRGDAWDSPSALRLMAGEMTAQEMRTARAVARGIAAAIRALPTKEQSNG
jgi:hypothetical protein